MMPIKLFQWVLAFDRAYAHKYFYRVISAVGAFASAERVPVADRV
jgi:hypothetical protein